MSKIYLFFCDRIMNSFENIFSQKFRFNLNFTLLRKIFKVDREVGTLFLKL